MNQTFNRIYGIDYLRAMAIIAVVLFHYHYMPMGSLGVDLFFVISGFLVSRPLIEQYANGAKIDYLKFFVARATKILPSYYFFLALGLALAYFMYREWKPEEIITLEHLPRYLFFFQNYRSTPHYSFDQVWSLCVEEHFYLMLPLGVFLLRRYFGNSKKWLFTLAISTIVSGNIFRTIGYFIGFETYSATHNRIDALAWGVLLALLTYFYRGHILRSANQLFIPMGLFLFVAVLGFYLSSDSKIYQEVIFHGAVAFCFFLMAYGALTLPDLKILFLLKWISRYSYNLYLWHNLFVHFIQKHFGPGLLGLVIYLVFAFSFAIMATEFIETPILKKREVILRGFRRAFRKNSENPQDNETFEKNKISLEKNFNNL